MFKKLTFNILLFLIIIIYSSCDGRYRNRKTNFKIVTNNSILKTQKKDSNIIPFNNVIEIISDTILSSGFHVKIQYKSIDNNTVLSIKKKYNNNTITKAHFNNFKANLEVIKNGKIINKSVIDKVIFKDFGTKNYWKQAIMQYVWINYEASNSNELFLNTSFNIPNTETYKDFSLRINKHGKIKIKELNPSVKTI